MDDLGGGAKPYDFLQITFHGKGYSVQPDRESRGRYNLLDDTWHHRMPLRAFQAISVWKAICRKLPEGMEIPCQARHDGRSYGMTG